MVTLNLAIAIMYDRFQTGHPLPPCAPIVREDTRADQACKNIFLCLEEQLHVVFPPQEQDAIYQIILSGQLMDASQLTFDTVQNFCSEDVLHFTHEYLDRISQVFGIDLRSDEDFYITLVQFIHYLQTPNYVLNDQENSDLIRSNLLAEYELACLIQPLALKFSGNYLNSTELLYLALCLSGALEFSSVQHPEQKLRTVICSHLNLPATWAIKRKVLASFGNHLDITALLPVNAKDSFDFQNTDLILSTVRKPISVLPHIQTLRISPYLSAKDYLHIETCIERHRHKMFCPAPRMTLHNLLQNAFWHMDCTPTDRFSMVELLSADFLENNLVTSAYMEDILHRESISSFAIKPGILLLHSLCPATETRLSIAVMKHRLQWRSHKIRLIIMACFHPDDTCLLFQLLHTLYQTHYEEETVRNLHTKESILSYYQKELPKSTTYKKDAL